MDPHDEIDEILKRADTDELAEAGKAYIKLGFSVAAFLLGTKFQNISDQEALEITKSFAQGLAQGLARGLDDNGPIV